jgi:hypothetical protein
MRQAWSRVRQFCARARVVGVAYFDYYHGQTGVAPNVIEYGKCAPSYPDECIPPPPPHLNCSDIRYRNFRVLWNRGRPGPAPLRRRPGRDRLRNMSVPGCGSLRFLHQQTAEDVNLSAVLQLGGHPTWIDNSIALGRAGVRRLRRRQMGGARQRRPARLGHRRAASPRQ